MKFVIKKLIVENFRCFEHLETELWERTKVSACNECGKTTLATAILWCLTGKDSEGSSAFEIVPTGKYGQVSPSVELECDVDGKPVTFKREYKASYARDKSFKDYTTVCYINGLKEGAKRFSEYISQHICGDDVFKILSNPYTFVENPPKAQRELTWQAQRRMLMELVEAPSNETIFAAHPEMEVIAEDLRRYDDASQLLSYLKQETRESTKKLDTFDGRITQQKANIKPVELSKTEVLDKIETAQARLDEIAEAKEVATKDASNEAANMLHEEILSVTKEIRAMQADYENEVRKADQEKTNIEISVKSKQGEIQRLVEQQARYADAVDKLKKQKVKTTCPTCKQPLTQQAIEAAKREIVARVRKGNAEIAKVQEEAEKKQREIEELTSKTVEYPVYPHELIEKKQDLDDLVSRLAKMPDEPEVDTSELDAEADKIKKDIDSYKQMLYTINANNEAQGVLDELKEGRAAINEHLNDLQMRTDVTSDFISERCKMCEETINALFPTVRFQLFEKNKSNDDIREVCNMTFNGHKYEDLSASTKLVANLELLSAFQRHYDALIPIICDNMESVTADIETSAQVVKMYVKEERCPKCGGKAGRRQPNGEWTCESCGHSWVKTLHIEKEAI